MLTFRAVIIAAAVGSAGPTIAAGQLPQRIQEALPRPVSFADGSIRTVNGIAFTRAGDTLFTTEWIDSHGPDGRRRARIVERRREKGRWEGPFPVPFGSEFTDYQPVMHPDGRRLFFQSTRPLPGEASEGLQNIWYVERIGPGWGAPVAVADLATPSREGYPSFLADGTIYFVSDRPGGAGGHDIYRARADGAGFHPPEAVPELNTADTENDLVVDPGGRFVILNRYVDATREIDLFLALADGNRFGPTRRLTILNGPAWELSPTISPDGRYFLYTVNGAIMQVALAALFTPEERARLHLDPG